MKSAVRWLRDAFLFAFWSLLWVAFSFSVNTYVRLWRETPPLKPLESRVETPRDVLRELLRQPRFRVREPGWLWVRGLREPYGLTEWGDFFYLTDIGVPPGRRPGKGFLFRLPREELTPGRLLRLHYGLKECPQEQPCLVPRKALPLRFPVDIFPVEGKLWILENTPPPVFWIYDPQSGAVDRIDRLDGPSLSGDLKSLWARDAEVYLADRGSGRVFVLDARERRVLQFFLAENPGQRFAPTALHGVPDEKLVVNDRYQRVYIFDLGGSLLQSFGGYGASGEGKFLHPTGVVADSQGRIFVADYVRNLIQVFQEDGTFLGKIGPQDFADSPLIRPRDLWITEDERFLLITGGRKGEGRVWAISIQEEQE